MDEDILDVLKFVGAVVGIILTILVFLMFLGIISFPARQAEKMIEHTVDVDTAFSNYEYFHDTYNDILAAKEKLRLAYAQAQDRSLSEEIRYTNQVNYTGLVNFIQSMVGEYNSKSSQWNRAMFKDKNLPYKLKAVIDGGSCDIIGLEE